MPPEQRPAPLTKGPELPAFDTPPDPEGQTAMALPGGAQAPAIPVFTVLGSCARQHPGVGAARFAGVRSGSSIALATTEAQGRRRVLAYVADADDMVIRTLDVASAREIAATPLRGAPEQLIVLGDGRVAVTLRADGAVQVLEPTERAEAPLETRCVVGAPTEPIGLALSPDDRTLLVTSGWAHALTAFDAQSFAPRFQADLPREPRSVVVSDDGKRAFVAHVVNATMSVVDLEGTEHHPRAIDLRMKQIATGGAQNGKQRGGCQGFALASAVELPPPDPGQVLPGERPPVVIQPPTPNRPAPSRPAVPDPAGPPTPKHRPGRLFAPFVAVDPGEVTQASSGYGSSGAALAPEVSAVSVIDQEAERSLTRAVFAPPGTTAHRSGTGVSDCILPRAAAYAEGSLYVTCLGNDALVELDARSVDPARAELRRWSVPTGPVGVAIDSIHQQAVVFSQFDHKVSLVPLARTGPVTLVALARRPGRVSADFERGRELFHLANSPSVSGDGRACASCHPDGREDALTWSTPEGPRQTLMLAGRLSRPAAFSWSGHNSTLSDHVHDTFKRLGGKGLPEIEMRQLLTYVNAMAAPRPTPVTLDASKKQLIERGREIFSTGETGCASCHPGGTTDGRRHDVGSRTHADKEAELLTPSLRFLSGTAPYFHDGRYATLTDMLDDTDTGMGHTIHLSRADRIALAAYLETL
jgi:DNA-binding beta-propeller fold protein YncE